MKSLYTYSPFEKLTLETSLSKDEVIKRLSANIDRSGSKRNWFTGINSSKHYFSGELNETSFQITRNISYKNSFLPVIKGEIEALRFGCTINLRLRLNIFAMVIGSIWFLAVLIACIGMISVYFSLVRSERNVGMLIPLIMLVFGYALVVGFFKFESMKARKFLKKLLEANESHA